MIAGVSVRTRPASRAGVDVGRGTLGSAAGEPREGVASDGADGRAPSVAVLDDDDPE